uniref:B30.2/SPRY domain-containing protein n=1 Tax=Xiphophorus couchianus TaxID=32473 RepID=A0A3B5LNN8_9TELE
MIESLGKLAFDQLQKRNLIFYESDLAECGIDIRAASVCSGVFTEIFREERGLYQTKLFCFVHLSVQEFLAALHVHLTFIKSGINLLAKEEMKSKDFETRSHESSETEMYKSAVDMALESPDGHLDLFLRFLLGLSLETNKCRLRGFVAQTEETLSSFISSTTSSLKDLDLSNNDLTDSGVKLLCEGLMSPNCELKILRLSGCLITEEGCAALASALTVNSSHLKELDLSYNNPGEAGMKSLEAILKNPRVRYTLDRLSVHHKNYTSVTALCLFCPSDSCTLTVDLNTVNRFLKLSHKNKKVTHVEEEQPYPDHPDRFDLYQLLCSDGLTGRCYWEVEWGGKVYISVSYRGINRKGVNDDSWFGLNDQSWSLICSDDGYTIWHDSVKKAFIPVPSFSSSSVSGRVAVYVDCPAGTLSFYRVSSDTLIHIYTFNTKFTETLCPAFGVRDLSGVCWLSF